MPSEAYSRGTPTHCCIHPLYSRIRAQLRAASLGPPTRYERARVPTKRHPGFEHSDRVRGGSTPPCLPTGRRESRGPAAPGRRDSRALGAPTFLVSEPFAGPDVRKQRDKGVESKGQTSPASGPREDRRSGRAYPSITTSEAGIEPSGVGEASERAQPSPGRALAVLHRARKRESPLGRV